MLSSVKREDKNKRGEWVYTTTASTSRRKIKRHHSKVERQKHKKELWEHED